MTGQTHRVLLAGGLLAIVLAAAPARAAIPGEIKFTAPFAFEVAGRTLPAGRYIVVPADVNDPGILMLRGDSSAVLLATLNTALPRTDPGHTEVVFKKNGNHYLLSRIWDEPSQEGADVIASTAKSRLEHREQRERGV